MGTVVVPRIAGAVSYDPTNVAITGGTSRWNAGSASAPSVADSTGVTGLYWFNAQTLGIAANSTGVILVNSTDFRLGSGYNLSWTNLPDGSGSVDTTLSRGAAGVIKFASANSFSANGSVATSLTSVGPAGASTTVQKWLTIQDSGGATRYIPCF